MVSRFPSLAGAAVLVAGCAPQVELASTPTVQSPQWRDSSVANLAPPPPPVQAQGLPTSLAGAFRSPELAALIGRALAANADIGAAAARIAQARAQLGIARAAALPVVTASAGLSETRTDDSGNSLFDFSNGVAGLDVSWEIDLFGRLAAGRRAARARYAAAAFDRDAVALAVEAETARAFVQHAALGDRIRLLDRSIASARELERIIGVRRRLGVASRVETGIAAVEARQLEVERSRLIQARSRIGNALAVLAGAEAPVFTPPQASLAAFALPVPAISQPPELVVRRPDVRAAEARIAAASGDVRQARAAFFPQLSLSASGIGQAASLGGPLGATLAVGADLLAPIFDRGRLNGRLHLASAVQRESVETYRSALLNALREAQDALSATAEARTRHALLAEIVEEARETARLARIQYVEGEADLQTVLDAEQRLVAVEDALAMATQERLEAAIDLYRAMGGSPRA
ncbi:MAG TPA: efflux transporter outer membrane subunit [Allosphingosinicella sp.]